MEYILEVPDQKQEFIKELLQAFSYVKLTPTTTKPARKRKQDTTEYLLSTRANRERLLASIERLERSEGVQHDFIEE